MGNLTRLMAKNYNTMQTILLNNGIHMPLWDSEYAVI